MLVTDYGKAERPAVLHRAWQALHAFVRTHGRNPRPRHQVGGDGGGSRGVTGEGGVRSVGLRIGVPTAPPPSAEPGVGRRGRR